ncbi:chromodomain-helicase-DNA-binding protein 7-like isoform X3 [Limulus polyphemus]|uniref:Chromodomain-helicase-DNA-binding protein 7-like isoform X3 n=1 Tax=Limulus polyphemus TaxID=6850 RepID=A0ABM1BAU5_LIMPO|nr:chromodomain-helicase-DNA-binding protein 7-like isoform X3 [Limulus polyphemus]
MDDYHLLGGGMYEMSGSGGMLEDPSRIVGGVGYGPGPSQNVAGSGMMSSHLSPNQAQSPGQMISSVMTQQPHANTEGYQMGIQQVYQQNELPQKFQHYSGYGNRMSGMVNNQFPSGGRLHHMSNNSIPAPGDQAPRPLTPSQIANYQQGNMLATQYAQHSQQPTGPSVNLGQSASQYSGYSRGSVPQQQPLSQTGDMWQGSMGQQHGHQYMPQAPSYSHPSQPAPMSSMQRCMGPMSNASVSMQVPRSSTPNQYMSRQEFSMHSPNQTTTGQHPAIYTAQPSPNGPYLSQMRVAVSQPLSHIPVTQSEQAMPSYSAQGPYSVNSQPGVTRPRYSPSSSLNAITPGDSPAIGPLPGSRPMQRTGYSSYSHLNSGQQPITPMQPATPTRIQQYPQQSYSPSQSYHHQSSQHQASILGSSSPSQLSPYPQAQQPPQAPNSPQFRPAFPPSQVCVSPRRPTPTPPAGSPMSTSHTPERLPHPPMSTTPQSQGSYPSPCASHLSSPGQGLSPGGGNSGPSSSLQQLEQMVIPHVGGSGSSKASTPNTCVSSSIAGHHIGLVGASYYNTVGQCQSQQPQQQINYPSTPSVYSQSLVSQQYGHQQYMGQPGIPVSNMPASVNSVVVHVPNSRPVKASGPNVMNDGVRSVSVPPSEVSMATSVTYSTTSNGNIMHSSPSAPEMSYSYTQGAPGISSNHSSISSSGPQSYSASTAYAEWNRPSTYEVHGIQQELQHLYTLPQSPQNQQKIGELQDRLRMLQSQVSQGPNTSLSMPPTVTSQGVPPYPQPSSQYNSVPQTQYIQQQQHLAQYGSPLPQTPSQQGLSPIPPTSQYSPRVTNDASLSTVHVGVDQGPVSAVTADQQMDTSVMIPQLPLQNGDIFLGQGEGMYPMPPEQTSLQSLSDQAPTGKKTKGTKSGYKSKKSQAKANRIVMEAVAKAHSAGNTDIPKVLSTEEVTSISFEFEEQSEHNKPKKAKKRKTKEKEVKDGEEPKEPKPKKPKKAKAPKEPKEKTPKPPKPPKPPKQPKPKKDSKKSKVKKEIQGEEVKQGGEEVVKPGEEIQEESTEKKEVKPKTVQPKEKTKSSPKKKLPKVSLKFCKKKRKRLGSSDKSDLEVTPPPSPEGEGVQKRRSARNTKRKRYRDDIELALSDDDALLDVGLGLGKDSEKAVQVLVDVNHEDTMVVEKVLTSRIVKREVVTEEPEEQILEADVEEFFVKYKGLSYIHCEWKTAEELERGDRRVLQKLKRFKQKKESTNNFFDFLEEEPFNPDYVEVDRVLDVTETSELLDITDVSGELQKDDAINAEDVSKQENEINEKSELSEDREIDKYLCEHKTEEVTEMKKDKDDIKLENDEETIKLTENKESIELGKNKETAESEFVKLENNPVWVQEKELIKTNGDSCKEGAEVVAETGDKLEDESEMPTEESEHQEVKETNESSALEDKPKKVLRHYLVKWRGLSYEDSTWELEEDVDPIKIEQFYRFREPPPKDKWKLKKKPKPSEWKKMEESPVYKGANTLREYQLEGLSWLTFCWYNGQNCILADEMGLGKTIQSIAFLNEIANYGIPGPFLVIAPLSTIANWQREFETWTDLNVITYHGTSTSRNMIQEYEMYYRNEKRERIIEIYKFNVMITTFEILLTDCLELREIPWRCVIIDEAHRLKNRNCKLLEGLRLLNMEHRVLLTGTPLQNNVEELFSLLNFVEPNRFTSNEAFLEEFGDLKTESQVDKLKAILKPMMLRRLKEDVEKSLVPKEETIVEVELTNVQKKYYRAILERNFTFLTKGSTGTNVPNLMNTMMELRKCCIHPYLINGAEEQIISEFKAEHGEMPECNLSAMIQASGKLVLLDKLLPRLRANDHRVLVFSQMVRCLDILEDYLVHRRYPYERIDGRVRGNLRQAAIDRFCKQDSDRFVFLLCTRAGGLGINLTAADTVVIFDSDWNPQNDLQAQARCHRIGQSRAVKVYRLICRNTYEREMFDKASLKLGLDRAVLQSMNSQKEGPSLGGQMTKKEIEDLLRKGAYGALMDDDNAGDKFCEEDIDQILERRTRTITIESEGKGSTFAKATFSAGNIKDDIALDDPEFWEKWAQKANIDVDELKNKNELIVKEPRRRTQTRRFGADDHMLDLSDLESSDDDDDAISSRTRGGRGRSPRGSICGNRNRGRGGRRGGGFDREREEDLLEEVAPGNWTRAECFKVEKGLLTFGWGRWEECLALGQFKRSLTIKDVEDISRTVLLFCLQHYRGDEKIKGFIWDLITPTEDGETRIHKNHSGLSAPVPRGRKGRKLRKDGRGSPSTPDDSWADWARNDKYNPDFLLNDIGYRKHLQRHANKVLLRVRLLYYLKHEVIGELWQLVAAGFPSCDIPIPTPFADGEPPVPWWDKEADKSLLIGVYKHGYERYNVMRQDPALCFLGKCGPPDGAALLAEMTANDEDIFEKVMQKDRGEKDFLDDDDSSTATLTSEAQTPKLVPLPENGEVSSMSIDEPGKLAFPTVSDLNTRLRRVITSYQRTHKKEELRLAQRARRMERREKFEAAIKERELKKKELQQSRWSRREEADFYRTVSSFGVEFKCSEQKYVWNRFRAVARLDRKFDDTLTEYFKAFYAMCKRVCGRKLTDEEAQLPLIVEPISEERASRCLQRIDLLNKIREEILFHPELEERLKLCQPSMDLPDWWQCGKHDKDLLIGAAKYGMSRLDYHLIHDPNLSFKDVLRTVHQGKAFSNSSQIPTPSEGTSPEELKIKEETQVKEEKATPSKDVKSEDELKSQPKRENSEELSTKEESEAGDVKREISSDDIKEEENKIEYVVNKSEVNEQDEQIITTKRKKESQEIMSEEINITSEDKDILKDHSPKEEATALIDKNKTVEKENKEVAEESETPSSKGDVESIETCLERESTTEIPGEENSNIPSSSSQAVEDKNLEGETNTCFLKSDTPSHLEEFQDISQNDEIMSQDSFNLELDHNEPTVAQLLAHSSRNPLHWPKDKVLQIRIEHICHAVEKNEWPIIRHTFMPSFMMMGSTAGASVTPSSTPTVPGSVSPRAVSPAPSSVSQLSDDASVPSQHTPDQTPLKEPILQDMLITASEYGVGRGSPIQPGNEALGGRRRRRRRRRFEIEAERAKLRALVSHSLQQQQLHQQLQHQFLAPPPPPPSLLRTPLREDHSTSDEGSSTVTSTGVTSTASTSGPPPAHQSSAPRVSASSGTLDLRVKPTPTHAGSTPTNLTPSSPESLGSPSAPMDLSSSSLPLSLTSSVNYHSTPRGRSPTRCSRGSPRNSPNNRGQSSPRMPSPNGRGRGRGKSRVRGRGRIGSKIDALALSLQARKQQEMLLEQERQRQHMELLQSLEKSKEEERQLLHATRSCKSDEQDWHLRNRTLNVGLSSSLLSSVHPHNTESSGSSRVKKDSSPIRSKADESSGHSSNISLAEQAAAVRQDLKKWMDEHPELIASNPNLAAAAAAAMAFSPLSNMPPHTELLELPEGRRRGRRPRLDPSRLDPMKLTGEENVSVVNRVTGKKITGSKAPPLKHLSEWLEKNPMFDVDPKWGPLVKEKGNLPDKLQGRLLMPTERRGGRRTAASLLASVHQSLSSPTTTIGFPSPSSMNPLNFASSSMLPGFSGGMKFFMDPSKGPSTSAISTPSSVASAATPPLFLPFGGLAGMGLANPLFSFPGFSFPGLQGTSSLGSSSGLGSEKDKNDREQTEKVREKSSSGTSSKSKGVTLPPMSATGTSSASVSSSTSSLPSASSLPFLYPTLGLLYNPLSLGGFSMPPNMPGSFASLAQSGLVNGLVGLNNPCSTQSVVSLPSVTGSLFSSTKSSSISVIDSLSSPPTITATAGNTRSTTTSITRVSTMSSGRDLPTSNLLAPQDSDDESLKSLMGNHDDDDDDGDLDDEKLDTADSLGKDDSETEEDVEKKVTKELSSVSDISGTKKTEISSKINNKGADGIADICPSAQTSQDEHKVSKTTTSDSSNSVEDKPS